MLLYVFKALHGLAPEYISDLISLHQSYRSLRSNDQLHLMVPRSRLKCKGDRAFSVAAPRLWNDLPLSNLLLHLLYFRVCLKLICLH